MPGPTRYASGGTRDSTVRDVVSRMEPLPGGRKSGGARAGVQS